LFPLFLAPHLAVLATAGAAVADGDEKAARAAEKAARAAKLAQAMAVVTFTKKIDQVLRCAQIHALFIMCRAILIIHLALVMLHILFSRNLGIRHVTP